MTGPFKHLDNHWRFVPHGAGCEIHLDLDFEFKSRLLDKMLGGMFGRACEKMVGAFTARANALYGSKPN
ncbi:MAG: SRPBCC family protein [Rickettsiales bacterium]